MASMNTTDDDRRLWRWLLAKDSLGAWRECGSLADWWASFRAVGAHWSVPIDQAVVGGFCADRLGYAFAAGYQAALRRLLPTLPHERMAALCVTEEGGGHPRAVRTTLNPAAPPKAPGEWVLDGQKKWATLSPAADVLFVAASVGADAAGRNSLRLVRVDRQAPGVEVPPMPATPFTPEIPHGTPRLTAVRVAAGAILAGDGYERYVKPFRTIEDTHVNAALLGYLFGVASRFAWPGAAREELLALLAALRSIGLAEPTAVETHIALSGFFALQGRVLEAIKPHWSQVSDAERARWDRDAAITRVAGGARAKRLEAAWREIGNP